MNDPILVITGPTASGKTVAALTLARENPDIEIVNADASLLYRGFDIGTAKPDRSVLAQFRHHLIDTLDPHDVDELDLLVLRKRQNFGFGHTRCCDE